jgi:Family of unknown function (DUF6627)
MNKILRTTIVAPTVLLFSLMTLWMPAANAAMLGTGSADTNQDITPVDGDAIQDFLTKESVRQQLVQLGVAPDLALERASSLTLAERQYLNQKIAELPAGAGALEVIGIVFLVLLILELVGVTDIFKKI